jgi:hypothetical protein
MLHPLEGDNVNLKAAEKLGVARQARDEIQREHPR